MRRARQTYAKSYLHGLRDDRRVPLNEASLRQQRKWSLSASGLAAGTAGVVHEVPLRHLQGLRV